MLMPMVILLFVIIFYLTFYLYNRCIAAQDTYILAFRGALLCGEEDEIVTQYVQSEGSRQYGNKYIAAESFADEVCTERKFVRVEVVGTMTSGLIFSAKKEAERICPVELIRRVRFIGKMSREDGK